MRCMKRFICAALACCWSTRLAWRRSSAKPSRRVRRRASAGDRPRVRRAAVDSQRRRRSRQHQTQRRPAARRCSPSAASPSEILETGGNPLVFAELARARAHSARSCSTRTTTASRSMPKAGTRASPFTPICATDRMEDGGQEIANFLSLKSVPARGASLRALGLGRQGARSWRCSPPSTR